MKLELCLLQRGSAPNLINAALNLRGGRPNPALPTCVMDFQLANSARPNGRSRRSGPGSGGAGRAVRADQAANGTPDPRTRGQDPRAPAARPGARGQAVGPGVPRRWSGGVRLVQAVNGMLAARTMLVIGMPHPNERPHRNRSSGPGRCRSVVPAR
jgi:hypothetical protein